MNDQTADKNGKANESEGEVREEIGEKRKEERRDEYTEGINNMQFRTFVPSTPFC